MSVRFAEWATRAHLTLTAPQRELLAHLVTTTPHLPPAPVEAPVSAADLRVIASLRARILDEMGRLTGGEAACGDMVRRLGALCVQSLHYVLAETGEPESITRWVEAALLLLAEASVIRAPQARRERFVEEGQR
jgi:hypothetical protein